MQLWYPGAEKRPLGKQAEPLVDGPRVLIFHRMAGYLRGTDSMFKQDGYSGTESHFGVGGNWDPAGLDGAVWQWQSIDRQADAQFAGNAYSTSIETSDGARDGIPWSPKQLRSLIDLATWWCRQTGVPARLVSSPSDSGFGFHSQFPSWNKNAHDCPGDPRVHQLRNIIIPEVAHRLDAPSGPRTLRVASPLMHGPDVEQLQKDLNTWKAKMQFRSISLKVDGWYGDKTASMVTSLKKRYELPADGVFGPSARAALADALA